MRISILTLTISLLCVLSALAQPVDYKKIILPDDATNISFEERLVQLAWKNNPASQIANEEVILTKEELKIKRTEWSSLLGVTGNLNEFSVKDITNSGSDDTQGNLFFPRYNFYINLPLSLLVTNPHHKNAAKSRVRASEQKVNLLKLELRNRVLTLYSDFKKAETILNIRRQSTADEESNYALVEQKFKTGEASLDDYIRAQRTRNDVKIQMAIAENEYQKAKFSVEEVIGIRLEDVK